MNLRFSFSRIICCTMLRDARTVLFSERNRFSLWLLQGLWQILGRDLEISVISFANLFAKGIPETFFGSC